MAREGPKSNMGSADEGIDSMFKGVVALFVEHGIQPRRLQVWTQKLVQRGGVLRKHINKTVTHIFAKDAKHLEGRVGRDNIRKLRAALLKCEWMEDCLKGGKLVPCEPYFLMHEQKPQTSGEYESQSAIADTDVEKPEPKEVKLKRKTLPNGGELSESDESPSKSRKTDEAIFHGGASAGSLQSKTPNASQDSSSIADSPTPFMDMASQEQSEAEMTYSPPNLNENITNVFSQLRTIFGDAFGEDFKSQSYHKAVLVLEKLPFKITSVADVKGLQSIGKSMKIHIEEILSTGTMAKLEHFKSDEKVSAITEMSAVWGIGPKKARELYAKGYRTVQDLASAPELHADQRIGLKFHTDINTKIPRHEVQEMEAMIRKVAESIDKDVILVCGGSYRRGKAFVGDMDIVITHPDGHSHVGYLRKLLQNLKEIDFITEDLRVGIHTEDKRAVDTYFGLCKYPGRELRHRIDFKVFPYEKYPFGLIHWTGNDVLNRRIRIVAKSKGFSLDEHGLYPVTTGADGEREVNKEGGIPLKTEREVFDFLGFPWYEPHERNL